MLNYNFNEFCANYQGSLFPCNLFFVGSPKYLSLMVARGLVRESLDSMGWWSDTSIGGWSTITDILGDLDSPLFSMDGRGNNYSTVQWLGRVACEQQVVAQGVYDQPKGNLDRLNHHITAAKGVGNRRERWIDFELRVKYTFGIVKSFVVSSQPLLRSSKL